METWEQIINWLDIGKPELLQIVHGMLSNVIHWLYLFLEVQIVVQFVLETLYLQPWKAGLNMWEWYDVQIWKQKKKWYSFFLFSQKLLLGIPLWNVLNGQFLMTYQVDVNLIKVIYQISTSISFHFFFFFEVQNFRENVFYCCYVYINNENILSTHYQKFRENVYFHQCLFFLYDYGSTLWKLRNFSVTIFFHENFVKLAFY